MVGGPFRLLSDQRLILPNGVVPNGIVKTEETSVSTIAGKVMALRRYHFLKLLISAVHGG
jgi:hypothetical protein